jgi:2-polyprenyl-3-methyl-5-hydroxy-6-metoxy-1,4-benzoquinol methylase
MTENFRSGKDERFEFGRNWASYLSLFNRSRVGQAEESLRVMLGIDDLHGLLFLDIGCGSGLFSLAARNLGAAVISFDFDAESVACTQSLRSRFYPEDREWIVYQGSVLDSGFMNQLPFCDIVYSWGVLHHTGDMWRAIQAACDKVNVRGKIYLSIYNRLSDRRHKAICKMKLSYVKAGPMLRKLIVLQHGARYVVAEMLSSMLQGKHPWATISAYNGDSRGMSFWHDIVDWVGGYPYEAARPEEVFDACLRKGFRLMKLSTNQGHGCNQFVFIKE